MTFETNPYQPPDNIEIRQEPRLRHRAIWSLRGTWLVLLPAALFNYYAFDQRVILSYPLAAGVFPPFRIINLLGFLVGSLVICCWLLPLLEQIARFMRRALVSQVPERDWLNAFYRSVHPAVFLALPGSVIWALWVIGFYYLKIDFVLISAMAAIPSHVLGACLYVPLLYRWGRLWWQFRKPSQDLDAR